MEATLRDVLPEAYKRHTAIAHFNFRTLEDIEPFVEAACELNVPIVIACSPKVFNVIGGRNIVKVYRALASCCKIPVVLHLDHATDLGDIWRAIAVGFTSVMIDGSSLPYEENVKLTSTVVKTVRSAGISVEGELGVVGGREDSLRRVEEELFTDPKEAFAFVKETEVDALAVAVGSVHGFYKSPPKLAFDRIKEISEITKTPLVLHGGTGIPITEIKKAISLGIAKVNIGTEFKALIIQSYRELSQDMDDIVDIVSVVKKRLKEKAKELLKEINN